MCVLTRHLSLSLAMKGAIEGHPLNPPHPGASKCDVLSWGRKEEGGGRGGIFRFNLSHVYILVYESTHEADLVPLPLDSSIYVRCMALLHGSVA